MDRYRQIDRQIDRHSRQIDIDRQIDKYTKTDRPTSITDGWIDRQIQTD